MSLFKTERFRRSHYLIWGTMVAVGLLVIIKGAATAQDEVTINPGKIKVNQEGIEIDSAIKVETNGRGLHLGTTAGRDGRLEVKNNDRVKMGGSIVVKEGEIVPGDVVAIGGSVTIAGTVKGDVVAIGGSIILKPTARVEGDAVSIGGQVQRETGSQIEGDVVSLGFFPSNIVKLFSGFKGVSIIKWSFLYRLTRIIVLLVLACLITVFLPKQMDRVTEAISSNFFKVALLGILGEILIFPLIVLMAITIIGIPLIPVLIIIVLVAMLMGFTATSLLVGRKFQQSANLKSGSPLGAVILGALVILSLSLLGGIISLFAPLPATGVISLIGAIIVAIAYTVGFGGILATKFGSPERG